MASFGSQVFVRRDSTSAEPVAPHFDIPRLDRLKVFVEREDFICRIGSSASKAGAISYCELPDDNGLGKSGSSQLMAFFKGQSGALIIVPAAEPNCHSALRDTMGTILGAVVRRAAFFGYDFSQEIAQLRGRLPYVREDYAPTPIQGSLLQYGVGYKEFTLLFLRELAYRSMRGEDISKLDVAKSLDDFAIRLTTKLPCILPAVRGRGSLVMVAMSPQYLCSCWP